MIELVRVVFRCWRDERHVLLVKVYDIGMTLTGSLVGLFRRAYLLVEKTADEAGRASGEVLFRVLLHHMYFYITTFRDVIFFLSLLQCS